MIRYDLLEVLLEDSEFVKIKIWTPILLAVGADNELVRIVENMFALGLIQVSDVIHFILDALYSKCDTEAEVSPLLVRILRELNLSTAADLIQDYINRPEKLLVKSRELLDEGAFGEVLKVKGILDGKEYALKKISIENFIRLTPNISATDNGTECFRRLVREVDSLKTLQDCHHVVKYHFAWFEGPHQAEYESLLNNQGTSAPFDPNAGDPWINHARDNYFFIKMELCDTDLKKWMASNPAPRSLSTVDLIVKQILEGLSFIHALSLIHRDLKPNNILMNLSETRLVVKIGDLGLSRDTLNASVLSQDVGCPRYRSPEMLNYEEYDAKTDVFSLGVIYLELLNPFTVKELGQVRRGEFRVIVDAEESHKKKFGLLRQLLSTTKDRPTSAEALEYIGTE